MKTNKGSIIVWIKRIKYIIVKKSYRKERKKTNKKISDGGEKITRLISGKGCDDIVLLLFIESINKDFDL